METYNDQLFPPAFLVNYTKEPAGRQRVLTYSLFRFLSCVSEEHPDLAQFLADQVSCPSAEDSFEILEDYLSADDYFSPSIAADGFEPFYLYAAIVLTAGVPFGTTTPVINSLIEDHAPEAASLPYADGNLPLDALLVDCRNFVQLTDTLVAAPLNYYNTDFGTLLETEIAQNLSGTGSRFAGLKRYGSVRLPAIADTDKACHMLANLFRYAALYELRSHLFDFHLDEDRLITLDNWQTELHWHYVQYANVYQLALDSFQSAVLSRELLHRQFLLNLSCLNL